MRITTLRYYVIALFTMTFANGLQLMLLFVKIKYALQKTYGGQGYKGFA